MNFEAEKNLVRKFIEEHPTLNITLIEDYYGSKGQYIGGSVWATEHSVATVWGPGEGEYDYVKAQLTRSDPNSIPNSKYQRHSSKIN